MEVASQVVHLVFKTHLDIGFTDLPSRVMKTYFDRFVPMAVATADRMIENGSPDRFVWTTGSWLIYEYLEQASPQERRTLERAIEAGSIRWHALPFTSHTELLEPELFRYGLSLSAKLDQRFGKKTVAGKMTDVPGHTIGMVPFLAEAGIEFLHIGVNSVCVPPHVPPAFRWRHSSGAEVVVMYNDTYGGVASIPGSDQTLVIEHSGNETGDQDNTGPHTAEQAQQVFDRLKACFSTSSVVASDLSRFAVAVRPATKRLPVLEAEIGDTWIHGAGSDPVKVARFRELSRLRAGWVAAGRYDEEILDRFSRHLLLVPEHTWGVDEKRHLADTVNYGSAEFARARHTAPFRFMERSWNEQREYVSQAVLALAGTDYAEEARSALARITLNGRTSGTNGTSTGETPRRSESGRTTQKVERGIETRDPRTQPLDVSASLETVQFSVRFDPQTGAISHLMQRGASSSWVREGKRLGAFSYQTFSQEDYDRFLRQYHTHVTDWSEADFSKPGMESAGAESREWLPRFLDGWVQRDQDDLSVTIHLRLPSAASDKYGCPRTVTCRYRFPNDRPEIHITVHWEAKPATRLPEAIWFSFDPLVHHPHRWQIEKLGAMVSPFDVVKNGGRGLHGTQGTLRCDDGDRRIEIITLDAPLVAPGRKSLLNFDNAVPAMDHGVHVNLYNNVWGTNFPMWFDEAATFRFVVRCSAVGA